MPDSTPTTRLTEEEKANWIRNLDRAEANGSGVVPIRTGELRALLDELAAAKAERDAVMRTAWWGECEIIPKYMPPYPRPETTPTVVIRHKPSGLFLRYSAGPRTGSFWDAYGDHFLDIELATSELVKAMPPRLVNWNAALAAASGATKGEEPPLAWAPAEGDKPGHWEAVRSGEMWRVRWSVPGDGGEYLWVGHYPDGAWGKGAAESNAEQFNRQPRSPYEWACFKPRRDAASAPATGEPAGEGT